MIFRGRQNAFSFLIFEKKNLATKIYSTKILIYNQQEIDWTGFWTYYLHRLLEIWDRRKKIHVLEISLKELFSKHENGNGNP